MGCMETLTMPANQLTISLSIPTFAGMAREVMVPMCYDVIIHIKKEAGTIPSTQLTISLHDEGQVMHSSCSLYQQH
jgi:hypothetical protein